MYPLMSLYSMKYFDESKSFSQNLIRLLLPLQYKPRLTMSIANNTSYFHHGFSLISHVRMRGTARANLCSELCRMQPLPFEKTFARSLSNVIFRGNLNECFGIDAPRLCPRVVPLLPSGERRC